MKRYLSRAKPSHRTAHYDFASPIRFQIGPDIWLGVLAVLGIGTIMGRLWYLQVLYGADIEQEAIRSRVRIMRQIAPRGDMLDRNGRPLAMNRPRFVVSIQPSACPEGDDWIDRTAHMLDVDPERVRQAAGPPSKRRWNAEPIPVISGASPEIVARVEENRPIMPWLSVDTRPVRYYPLGKIGSHVLGRLGQADDKDLATWPESVKPGDAVGKSGLELQYQHLLAGEAGGVAVEVDVAGRQRRRLRDIPPHAGATLHLTLDRRLMEVADKAFGQRRGAVAAVDPRNGEVLVLASFPRYDANLFAGPIDSKTWRQLVNDPSHPLHNRSIGSKYPPGSTFKLISAAATLEYGASNLYTTYHCPGYMMLGRRKARCHKVHGTVDLIHSLSWSCDVYYYRNSLKFGIDRLAEMAHRFGLGHRSGIDLPGELRGTIPDSAWKKQRYRVPWYPGDTINASIGQGFVQTTPLQMALATAAIANNGILMKPHLVRYAKDPVNGKRLFVAKPEVLSDLKLKPSTIRAIQAGLAQAVDGPGGTAAIARLPGLTVAAKTGTAEDPPRPLPNAWFVAYAPRENPQIAICVLVEQGRHGGSDAGPVARKMLIEMFRSRLSDTVSEQGHDSGGGD